LFAGHLEHEIEKGMRVLEQHGSVVIKGAMQHAA
jgi:hypothetical protein